VPGFFTVCVRLVERRQHLLNVRPPATFFEKAKRALK
jgi:hypothetical protein